MPSHTETDPKTLKIAPSWMKHWHVIGNKTADELASMAAASHAIPKYEAQFIVDILKKLHLVQDRISVVTKMFPQRPHNTKRCKLNPVSMTHKIDAAIALSSHNLFRVNSRLVSTSCNSSVSMKTKHVFDFIASICIPEDKLISLPIGKLHTHITSSSNVWWSLICTKCGATARNKFIKSQFDCAGRDPETGTHGLDNLERYARGSTP